MGGFTEQNGAMFMSELAKYVKGGSLVDTMSYDNLTVVHMYFAVETLDWGDPLDRALSISAFRVNADYLGLAYVTSGTVTYYTSNIVSDIHSFTEKPYTICQNSTLPAVVEYPTVAWYYEVIALMANISDVFLVRLNSICDPSRDCLDKALLDDALTHGGGDSTPPDQSTPGSTTIELSLGIPGNSGFRERAFMENVNSRWGPNAFGCPQPPSTPPNPPPGSKNDIVIALSVIGAVGGLCLLIYLVVRVNRAYAESSDTKQHAESTAPDTEPHNSTHPDSARTPAYDPYMPVPVTVADKHSWEVHSNDGRPYYYNRATGQSRWDTPSILDPNLVSATLTQCDSSPSDGAVDHSPNSGSLSDASLR
eukprot:TRINITY_DN4077_c0_g1_i1.p1 TRINITY_DN4077_c0_g1~~TRINITY_DN4077_c0_g1_i1.p1  ORF type:complete len:373 (+),score=0.43 TRINITY_DN4077_c0_g1_i1:25-1119(+)